MGRKTRLASAVLLAASGAAVVWWLSAEPAPAYSSVTLARADVEASVVAIGTLQPRESVDVGAQVSGQVTRLYVEPGDPVEKGQLLAEIDASVHSATVEADRAGLAALQALVAEQQAKLTLARQQYARQQRLALAQATRDEAVEIARADMDAAAARLDNLRAQVRESQARLRGNEALLSYTRLYAPISGTVLGVDVRQGQTLNATYQTPTVMRIADLSSMTAWTKVSEADIRQLRPGLPLHFTTLGGDGRQWHAKIRQILPAPQLQAANGEAGAAPQAMKAVQYMVLFDVDNADAALMPQMTAQVVFITAAASDVLVAPLAALHAVSGQPGRFEGRVLDARGRVQARQVQVGVRSRQFAEVLEGLGEGERLVTGELAAGRVPRFQW